MMKHKSIMIKKESDLSINTDVKENNGGYDVVVSFSPKVIEKILKEGGDKEGFSLEKTLVMSAFSEMVHEALSCSKNMGHFYHLITVLHAEIVARSMHIEEMLQNFYEAEIKKSAN